MTRQNEHTQKNKNNFKMLTGTSTHDIEKLLIHISQTLKKDTFEKSIKFIS